MAEPIPERAASAPVGIVGLGLMGEVYARRLIEAGIPVVGFDTDSVRTARLADIGGRPAPSIADLAKSARCIILAVFNTEQVEDVVEKELLPALGDTSGKIVLCMSTCDPDRVAALASRVVPRGIRYLDVPVSGTSDQVRRGDGVALIGGDKRGSPALAEGLSSPSGWVSILAFLEVARGSASYSQVMETKGPKMVRGDFAAEGRVKQTLKDVHLMLDQAAAAGQTLSVLGVHADVLEACVRAGEADLDNSAVIKEIRRRRT